MPSSTPLLRAINLSIAFLLLVLIVGVYWFVWRALPQTSGEISAPITAEASIVRDSLGVPHVTAKTWEDALFLQGYATAQDRMWQMDAMRRLAAGELAEIVGLPGLESDRDARRLRLPQLAEEQEKKLTQEARAAFVAYARGVNYYLETHREHLPLEFTILRYQPRPWRPRDTLLIGLHMSRTLTSSWKEELRKLHLLQRGDRAKVEYLYPARAGLETAPGSNAWAVSGAHTASGKPIVASDPHLEASMPSTWYIVHLKADGLDVTGASLPGVPAVIIGHNQRIAWGMTNLEFDLQDLVQLGGAKAAMVQDLIAVKGLKADAMTGVISPFGPMVASEGGQGYVLRWMAAKPDAEMDFAFLALNRAGNWNEFNAALARFAGPPQNFVYGDVDGNIGYHAAGKIPVRAAGCAGDVPDDGSCEWTGVVPFEELPQAFNPPSGVIVTSNQNPFPTDYKYSVAGLFAPSYRARQVRARIESKPKWTAEEMVSIQKDVYSSVLHFLAQQVVATAAKKAPQSESVKQAVEVLRGWNGQMEAGQAAPMVAALLYAEVKRGIAELAAPGLGGEYNSRMAGPVIERWLTERPEGWVKDYDAWLMAGLAKVVAEGEKTQGSNIARWDYGQYNEFKINSVVLGQLPLVGRYFDAGPRPMSGASTTVKQVTGKVAPSFRMVADLGNLEASVANITVGQSAHRFSPHYRDQFDAYMTGTSFPMQFGKVEAEDTLRVKPN